MEETLDHPMPRPFQQLVSRRGRSAAGVALGGHAKWLTKLVMLL